MEIVWEEPPMRGDRGDSDEMAAFIAALVEHPGRWARYPCDVKKGAPASTSQMLKRREPRLEVVTRQVESGSKDRNVWARLPLASSESTPGSPQSGAEPIEG